jgi:hypothetical protein
MYLREIYPNYDSDQLQAVVNTLMNFQFAMKFREIHN